jgi:general L-amino acid transport system substrate-binding protein
VNFTPVVIADQGELEKAFIGSQCDIMVNDVAALASFVTAQGANGSKYALLPFRISADVLSGVVRKDDPRWFDIVRWTQYALITAEDLGITKTNIDTFAKSEDPAVRRFLGLEGDFGKAMGINNAWAANIVKSVGNLAEVYNRNVAPLGIPRGANALWRDGGLQFSPAMR